jgi:hypothetical protein
VIQRGIHRARRCVHCAWLLALVTGFTRAISLRFSPAFPSKATPADVPSATEWQAGLAFICRVRQ